MSEATVLERQRAVARYLQRRERDGDLSVAGTLARVVVQMGEAPRRGRPGVGGRAVAPPAPVAAARGARTLEAGDRRDAPQLGASPAVLRRAGDRLGAGRAGRPAPPSLRTHQSRARAPRPGDAARVAPYVPKGIAVSRAAGGPRRDTCIRPTSWGPAICAARCGSTACTVSTWRPGGAASSASPTAAVNRRSTRSGRSGRRLGIPEHQQVDNEMVFYGSRAHPRGLGPLIRLVSGDARSNRGSFRRPSRGATAWSRNSTTSGRSSARLRRDVAQLAGARSRAIAAFEERHNAHYRYSKLGGRTPNAALRASAVRLALSRAAPRRRGIRCPNRSTGRYHVIRFVRSDGTHRRVRRSVSRARPKRSTPTSAPRSTSARQQLSVVLDRARNRTNVLSASRRFGRWP